MKKIFSTLIVTCILSIFMMGILTLADDVETFDVRVCGTRVTSANATDVLGDGTVSFNAASYTLTLNGAELYSDSAWAGIESSHALTIAVTADSSIETTDDCCLNIGADLVITGPKQLTLTYSGNAIGCSSNITLDKADLVINTDGGMGMYADSNITINDSVVEIDSYNVAIKGYRNSNITITDSELTLSCQDGDCICTEGTGEFTITNSTLNLKVPYADGIYSEGDNNIITGSTVNFEGGIGIYTEGSSAITDSNITINAIACDIFSGDALTVDGSEINAVCTAVNEDILGAVVVIGEFKITDSYMKVTANDYAAIIATKFTITEPCMIYSPKDATISDYTVDSDSYNTIALSDDSSTCLDVIIAAAYEITFADEDGTVLESDFWLKGKTPEYGGETPTKEDDDTYTYTFKGWDKEIVSATEDATYTAVYTAVEKNASKDVEKDDDSPNTGDSRNLTIFMLIAVLAVTTGVVVLKRREG